MAARAEPPAAFDGAASEYDRKEADNPIVRRWRRRSLAILEATFPAGARLLDVGAGTGTEALSLLAAGRSVVAVDPSQAMLDRIRIRAAAAGFEAPTHRLAARDLAQLVGRYGAGSFAGAYSSFGPLNCEPDLGPVAAALERLLAPGAAVVLGIMGPWAVSQAALNLVLGRPRRAFARQAAEVIAAVPPDGHMRVHYHSRRHLLATFAGFRLEHVEALGLLLPPSAWPRAGRWARHLAVPEDILGRLPGLGWLGDHYIAVLRRR